MKRTRRAPPNFLIAFVDLMLCSIGCALIVFIVLAQQPRGRGRGWHDRPLIIQARMSPGPLFAGLRCDWALRKAGSIDTKERALARPELIPADGSTRDDRPFLAIVPEAEFGIWTLTVTASAPRTALRELVGQLEARPLSRSAGVPTLDDSFGRYADLCNRVNHVLNEDKPLDSVVKALLVEAENLVVAGAGTVGMGAPGTGDGSDARLYMRCRRLSLISRLAGRLAGPFVGRRDEAMKAWTDAVARPDLVEDGASMFRLKSGLLFAEEAVADGTGRKPLESGKRLDEMLKGSVVGPPNGLLQSNGYYDWRNELVRLLACAENRREYAPQDDNVERERLRAVLAMGAHDPVLRLLAVELQSLGAESRLAGTLRVRWGDRSTRPADAGPKAPGDVEQSIPFSLAPQELGSEARVATIVLDLENPSPRVATGGEDPPPAKH